MLNRITQARTVAQRVARAAVLAAGLGIGAAWLTGCVATLGAEGDLYGYPVVYADTVPAEIYAYPRVYYNGGYAYLVNGQWYYPTARGWAVFRQEPVELGRYRTSLGGQVAPGGRYYAPGYASPGYAAPGYAAPGYAAPRYQAPPAPRYEAPPAPRYSAPPAPRYVAPAAPGYAPGYVSPRSSAPRFRAPPAH